MNNNEMTFSTDKGSPSASLKSTLVSLVPFSISEFKPGLIPGQFDIPASVNGEPQCLVIGESIYYVWIDPERGNLRITDPSYKVAKSICDDYNSAQIEASLEAYPALFWVLGVYTAEEIKKKFPEKIEEARAKQWNWFVQLVKLADDDWEKTRQHYSISDMQRYAAKAIDPSNSRQRPWLLVNPNDIPGAEKIPTTLCPACASDIATTAIICRYCQFVLDEEKYSKMKFAGPPDRSAIPPELDLKKLTTR